MHTDTVAACYIENNDFIVIDSQVVGYVYSITDESDYLHIEVSDDDGDCTVYAFAPFDPVTYVTSFEDDEHEDWANFYNNFEEHMARG